MKKKLALFSLTILIILSSHSFHPIKSNAFCAVNSYIYEETLCKDSILALLNSYIDQAITSYYGSSKQFDLSDARILSIKKPNPEVFQFHITVQVETFTGAHNSPRSIEIITISTSPEGTKIINFVHRPA